MIGTLMPTKVGNNIVHSGRLNVSEGKGKGVRNSISVDGQNGSAAIVSRTWAVPDGSNLIFTSADHSSVEISEARPAEARRQAALAIVEETFGSINGLDRDTLIQPAEDVQFCGY